MALFGSVARDTARQASDVDLLVSFDQPVGFITFVQVQHTLERILERRVDLLTEDSLRSGIRDRILAERVQVW